MGVTFMREVYNTFTTSEESTFYNFIDFFSFCKMSKGFYVQWKDTHIAFI